MYLSKDYNGEGATSVKTTRFYNVNHPLKQVVEFMQLFRTRSIVQERTTTVNTLYDLYKVDQPVK